MRYMYYTLFFFTIWCLRRSVFYQAGADVTKGYKGDYAVQGSFTEGNIPTDPALPNLLVPKPVTTPSYMQGMCPVNVHWYLGTEHASTVEHDETGTPCYIRSSWKKSI